MVGLRTAVEVERVCESLMVAVEVVTAVVAVVGFVSVGSGAVVAAVATSKENTFDGSLQH